MGDFKKPNLHTSDRAAIVYNLTLNGFVQVNGEEISQCKDEMRRSVVLRTVHGVCVNKLLSGLIGFFVDGKPLKDTERDFLNFTWRPMISDLIKSLWCYGFAAVGFREHAEYTAIPEIVDPEYVDVWMKKETIGPTQYVFLDRNPALRMWRGQGSTHHSPSFKVAELIGKHPLSNILVFESEPPERLTGMLNSRVKALRPLIETINIKRERATAILRHIERAGIIAEHLPAAGVSSDNIQMAMTSIIPSLKQTSGFDVSDSFTDRVAVDPESARSDTRECAASLLARNGFPRDLLAAPMGDTSMSRVDVFDVVQLPPGYKFAGQVTRTELKSLSEDESRFEEQVSDLFGVPIAMFRQANRTRTATNEQTTRSTFTDAQRQLKAQLLPMLTMIFLHVYGPTYAEYAVAHQIDFITSAEDCEKVLDLDAVDVKITLNGVPEFEIMSTLYQWGLVDAEHFNDYIAMSECIPRHHLVDNPSIEPRDIIGLQPLETTVTTSATEATNATQSAKKATTEQSTRINNKTKEAPKPPGSSKEKANSLRVSNGGSFGQSAKKRRVK